MKHRRKTKGFTLIELMIVLVIAAIILGLAYPSYVSYVRKSKRGDAQQALMNWSVNQEIWRSNHPTYAGTGDLPAPTSDYYAFTLVGNPTATSFTLQAQGQNDQANDKAKDGSSCATMQLNQNGQKTPAACWE